MLLATTESEALHWQYYTDSLMPIGSPSPSAGYLRCSAIGTDGDGHWISLYLQDIPPSTLPVKQQASFAVAVLADGSEFRLRNKSLRPSANVTQVIPIQTGGQEAIARLTVLTDGRIQCHTIGTPFADEIRALGAVSVFWYVLRS